MIKITKCKIKKGKRRKGERKFSIYRYITISFLKIFKISIGQLGFKKVDIRFEMKWGWE